MTSREIAVKHVCGDGLLVESIRASLVSDIEAAIAEAKRRRGLENAEWDARIKADVSDFVRHMGWDEDEIINETLASSFEKHGVEQTIRALIRRIVTVTAVKAVLRERKAIINDIQSLFMDKTLATSLCDVIRARSALYQPQADAANPLFEGGDA